MSIHKTSKSRCFYLGVVLLIGFVVYVMQLNHSAFWYDEAIEYFYSRYMSGEVPGGYGTSNMYERICLTYQPPLYNFLMYIWLVFFDSETGFRMAGVCLTLLGTTGIFCGLESITNVRWAAAGSLFYIFTSTIAYHALECAEYNLMLCAVAWTVCFFVKFLKEGKKSFLIVFFLCSVLSVYSQYGSAFLIISAYMVLAVHLLINRRKKMIKTFCIATVITGIAAVLPLLIFFLIPQMIQQGSVNVSHMPSFAYGNWILDFILCLGKQIAWIFFSGGMEGFIGLLPLFLVFLACIATFFALFQKEGIMIKIFLVCILGWLLYYLASACSFYGYNRFVGTVGTENIGNRYGLFFAPVLAVLLSYGTYLFSKEFKLRFSGKIYRKYILVLIVSAGIFIVVESMALYHNWTKDDVREVVEIWYKNNASEKVTLVHQWSDANFQFYLQHHDSYQPEYQEKICTTEAWIRDAQHDKMEEQLTELKIFELDSFYYVGQRKYEAGNYDVLIEVLKNRGYIIRELYAGNSVLLYLER